MREKRDFIHLDGARLEVQRIPAAAAGRPALVFLHEGLGCSDGWRGFPARLAAATGCEALVYSRAGYGRSSPVPVPRPLRYMHDEGLEVLPRLLDAAGLGEVVLVGHSDGGSIALIHAGGADAGGRVRGVIAEAPHVLCEDLSVSSIRKAREAFLGGDLRDKLARLHGENVDCAFWGWNRVWLDPGFAAWNIEEYLPSMRAPVLVIQGLQDPYGTGEQVRRIQAGCGGPTEVLLLDGCGHAPHRDQPATALDAMSGFVGRLGSTGP
ncbi:MAG TPA: alpha/beta hydrolase [Anaeromyxobacteraceae bacterium]|nr:alpha/beta hydrolase [Anaeromyxobacteraceae bacterium]